MRILFVTPFFEPAWSYGGMVTSVASSAKALANRGLEVEVYTTNANGPADLDIPLKVPIKWDNIYVTYFPRISWSGNSFISLGIFNHCFKKMHEFDCVYSAGLWTFPCAVISGISRLLKIPYVVSLNGTLMPWAYQRHHIRKAAYMRIVEKWRLAHAKLIICSSEMEKRHFINLGIPGKTEIIPNIVCPISINIEEERARFRTMYHLNGKYLMLFSGRLVENKGLHLTLKALSSIATRHSDVHLAIVGPFGDKMSAIIRKEVINCNLNDRVTFLGLLAGNDYWRALSAADLFVLNSYSENFGNAPAEALSLGIPVLLSDRVGISDMVEKYEAGIIAPLDVQSIIGAMESALANRENLRRMGQNGIRLVNEKFSASTVGGHLEGLLRGLAGGGRKIGH